MPRRTLLKTVSEIFQMVDMTSFAETQLPTFFTLGLAYYYGGETKGIIKRIVELSKWYTIMQMRLNGEI